MAARPNRLGPTVASLREAKGLSQSEVGKAVGWSRQRVGQFEGQKNAWPTPSVFNGLAEVLEVPVSILLRAAGVAIGDEADEAMDTLLLRASQLDDDGLSQLADIALVLLPGHRRQQSRADANGTSQPVPVRGTRAAS